MRVQSSSLTDSCVTLEVALVVGIQLDLGQTSVNVLFYKAILLKDGVNVIKLGAEWDTGHVDSGVGSLFLNLLVTACSLFDVRYSTFRLRLHLAYQLSSP